MNDFNAEAISPIMYFKVLFRRKELVIIPAFIGLILGICTGILLPKKYRSSTVILVEEGKTDNPLFNNLAVTTTTTQRLTAIRESMLGWNNLVQLVKRLNLDKDVKTDKEFEKLVVGIRKNILISLRGNNVINLNYVGDDAEKTRNIVQNITAIFIEKNVEKQNQEVSEAISFIEGLLKVYRGKIKSAEIAQLQEQLDALLIDSTEMHPRVKQLKEKINAQKKELEKENLEFSEDAALTSQADNNPIIGEIKKAIETLEAQDKTNGPQPEVQSQIYKVMLIDKLDKVMARDVGVNTQIYNMLLQRLETAKITYRLQTSKEGTKYTILDPPRVPLAPFYPKKVLLALIGMILGAMGGAGLIVSAEFLDKSFLDVEDAKNFLGTPLLGAISKINTEESIRREKEKTQLVYGFTIAGGAFFITLTVAILNLLK